jgi:peptidoglycan hydrolase-like protein with peptidoglycan-binding domain
MKYFQVCVLATLCIIPSAVHAGFFDSLPLKEGDTNSSVSSVQRALNSIGHQVTALGEETNYFGAQTLAAVKSFQCAYGIVCTGTSESTGFGIVGPRTAAFLDSLFTKFLAGKSSNLAALSGSGSGLISQYTFDADTTGAVADSASGDNGTAFGNPAYSSGHTGSAISFDGVDDHCLSSPTASFLWLFG